MTSNSLPLGNIRVVDMTTHIAGPSCARLLAYLGADVIKLESIAGDPYRTIKTYAYKPAPDETPIIDALNGQKKSISVNLKDERVRPYIYELIKKSDVFISNVRGAALKRLGLSYEELKEINPKLVYAHFSGFGETGGEAGKPGYDSTAFFSRSGIYRDFVEPDAPPLTHIGGLGDMMSGLVLTASVLGALIGAEKTGQGTQVFSSLCSVAAWGMLTPMILEQYGSHYQRAYGSPMHALETSYKCKDGEWVFIVATYEDVWIKLTGALGRPDLLQDPLFDTNEKRIENSESLFAVIAAEFVKKPYAEWEGILTENGVVFERIRHINELSSDTQLMANGYLSEFDYPSKTVRIPRPPFKIGGIPELDFQRAPTLGGNTKEIFQSLLGCSDADIEALAKEGILRLGG